MNKLFLVFLTLILVTFSVSASITNLDTQFVNNENNSVRLGNTIHIQQGEQVSFFIWVTTNTASSSYRALIFENNQTTDVVSHTLYTQCQTANFCDYVEYKTFDTTNLPIGNHEIRVLASDDNTQNYDSSKVLTLIVDPVSTNHAPNEPTNPFPANNAVGIERNLTLSWEATDPDNDTLTYTLYFGTDSNSMNVLATNFTENSYMPKNLLGYNTKYYWKVVANDGSLTKESPVWSFTTKSETTPTNHAPTIRSIGDQSAECSSKFTYSVSATDSDGDVIIYSDNTRLFNINSSTGLISFTPSCSDTGDYEITITATDSKGAATTEKFNLEIYRRSSGGGSSNHGNADEGETVVLKKLGECLDDGNHDKYGLQVVIYKTVNKLTNEVLSLRSDKQVCLLEKEESVPQPQQKLYDSNFTTIGFIAVGFIALSLAIILFAYKKLF